MQPPIGIFYELTPFYQNHHEFLSDSALAMQDFFNDTFHFDGINVTREGIAWNSDIKRSVFTNGVNPKVWEDVGATEEDYIVWMRASALPRVRKLWGKIDTELQAGANLSVTIGPQYDVSGLGVRKSLVIEEMTWL